MDSPTAIVTPAQLKHFADFLEESARRLRSNGKRLRESVKTANVVWKDAKYDTFRKQLSTCVDDLDRFNNTGFKYAEFLREKANLADKYLQRR